MEYTPGEWILVSRTERGYTEYGKEIRGKKVYPIRAGLKTGKELIATVERLENARLIASAPELLEACKLALKELGKYAPKEAYLLCRQAIAKVEVH